MMMNVTHVLQNNLPLPARCLHCGLMLPEGLDDVYCCHGCRSAHALIQKFELEEFYSILPPEAKSGRQTDVKRGDYSIFDSKEFQSDFVKTNEDQNLEAHFFISGMTCYACVWVCEQLTRKLDDNAFLSINMSTGEALLTLPQTGLLVSDYFKAFESLGYAVTPNRRSSQEHRKSYIRLGLAFFCLMNVMMLAIPEYLGAESLDPEFRQIFRAVSSVMAAAAIFYSGWPFLKNALWSFRKRTLHLDLPIGLALIVGYSYSFMNMVLGAKHVYFDSMTAVVALLLTGRFIQTKALDRMMREQSRFLEAEDRFVRVLGRDVAQLVPLKLVKRDDVFHVLPGEIVAIRCEMISDCGDVNYGLLKGETEGRDIQKGEEVLAGAMNGSIGIDLVALEDGKESFLLELQAASRKLYQVKGHALGLSEKMAKFFVLFTLFSAFGVGFWFLPTAPEEGFRRFAAVLLVACPCIFGFGAPMVLARAFQLGIKQGIIFRTQNALEELSQIKAFYFDKTGTLTDEEAGIKVLRWNEENLQKMALKKSDVLSLLGILPSLSRHHIPKALSHWAKRIGRDAAESPVVASPRESFGSGLSFGWQGKEFRLGRPVFCLGHLLDVKSSSGWTLFCVEGVELLRFTLEEALKPDAHSCVEQLMRLGKSIHILSGDDTQRVDEVGSVLGLPLERVMSNLSPDQKLGRITKKRSAMVGNGINDILASSASSIGIALANASDSMKAASDIVFVNEGISPLLLALELSQETRRVMKRCFGLALIFNIIAMSLALTGVVTPVMAAVLMPLSSITVFFSSQRFRMRKVC